MKTIQPLIYALVLVAISATGCQSKDPLAIENIPAACVDSAYRCAPDEIKSCGQGQSQIRFGPDDDLCCCARQDIHH